MKLPKLTRLPVEVVQPPSGGCVLKPNNYDLTKGMTYPAAFGRLCVETNKIASAQTGFDPAAFGRLCVETFYKKRELNMKFPAAFGRLCVETNFGGLVSI